MRQKTKTANFWQLVKDRLVVEIIQNDDPVNSSIGNLAGKKEEARENGSNR
ncbi:MAG: hypothetical protein JSV42_07600 [Chloroflexota bacterium]|nr:MAG: hypothetical protein JSV42_07600 [Chloroflexota bacterium]